MNEIRVSTPGRICLFGEHQDYLGLPVISCAISRRVTISGTPTPSPVLSLDLPDIRKKIALPLNRPLPYREERDYLRSTCNIMHRAGYTFHNGFSGLVKGDIPINSGTSSSSALICSLVALLARLSDQALDLEPMEIARLAHQAEVLEFAEPGGMMDHISTALGGILYIQFQPDVAIARLPSRLGTFVLGDSREPKDTRGILHRVKNGVLDIVSRLAVSNPGFSLRSVDRSELKRFDLSNEEHDLLDGALHNRDLTRQALQLLQQEGAPERRFGDLLNQHQNVLREQLKISTARIDRMLAAALAAGAWGGKINGSGGGGCMFAYAPGCSEKVAEAIEGAGGKACAIYGDGGTRIEKTFP